jgi:hypothetical protein
MIKGKNGRKNGIITCKIFFYDENKFIFTENMFSDVLKFVPIDKKIGFKFLNFYTK